MTPNNTVAGLAEKLQSVIGEMNAAADHAQAHGGNLSWRYPREWATTLSTIASPAPSAGVGVGVIGDAIRHLSKWLDLNDCECEAGHQCGRPEVQRTRDQLRALQHPAAPSVSPCVGATTGDAYETWCPGCGITISVPSPSVSPAYDRELIARMLDHNCNVTGFFSRDAIAEQARLLREAGNAEAASIRTVNRSPSVAGDAGELPELPKITRYDVVGDIAYPIHEAEFGSLVDYDDHAAAMRAYGEQCRRLATAEQPDSAVQGEALDYTDIANRAQEITGRSIYPSTAKAVLEAAGVTTPPPAPAAEQGQPEARGVEGRELALAVENALGWRDAERDAELDGLLVMAMNLLAAAPSGVRVDDAMVERACIAYKGGVPSDAGREMMRAALTAALRANEVSRG